MSNLRSQLTTFFERHNPDKIDNVPALLEQYRGREGELIAKIEQKYNEPVIPGNPKRRRSSGSIFDKLTDSSQYTGAHKQRFDETGRGRGLAGRDYVSKGTGCVPKGNANGFSGNTNTNTNTIYHDSAQFLMR